MILLLAHLATAGCPADPDPADRQGRAPLIVEGVVVRTEVIDEGDPSDPFHVPTVYELVRVTKILKGQLDRPGLRIRTAVPTQGCATPAVLPVGAAVYILGTPDRSGTVAMSACTGDVGRTEWRDDLAALAARHSETAQRFAGIDVPELRPTPTPLPPRSGLHGLVRQGDRLLRADFLSAAGAPNAALVEDGRDLWFREDLSAKDLQRVTTVRSPVAPGSALYWRAGVPDPRRADGLRLRVPFPAELLGDRWRDDEAPDPTDEHWDVLANTIVLYAGRGGTALVEIGPGARILDPGGSDWREISVYSAQLSGQAWVDGPVTRETGGSVGSVFGVSTTVEWVDLDQGDTLRDPTTGVTFAECGGSCRAIVLNETDDRVLTAVLHQGAWRVGERVRVSP